MKCVCLIFSCLLQIWKHENGKYRKWNNGKRWKTEDEKFNEKFKEFNQKFNQKCIDSHFIYSLFDSYESNSFIHFSFQPFGNQLTFKIEKKSIFYANFLLKKRIFHFPFSVFHFPISFSVFERDFPFSVLNFPFSVFHFPFSDL